MKKIIKALGVRNEIEVYNHIAHNYVNGNKADAMGLFSSMPRVNKKAMVWAIINEHLNTNISYVGKEVFFNLI